MITSQVQLLRWVEVVLSRWVAERVKIHSLPRMICMETSKILT